jgi:hypothetical protein
MSRTRRTSMSGVTLISADWALLLVENAMTDLRLPGGISERAFVSTMKLQAGLQRVRQPVSVARAAGSLSL